jgi:acyl-CoA synthetase (AMP-forming)/AMP-acid ligase II
MTTTIGPLGRAVQVGPERIAARCGETELTYCQWDRARRLIGALHALGDRVAVSARNCHRYRSRRTSTA